eukprot:802139-Karenia_brevis.AAC.1
MSLARIAKIPHEKSKKLVFAKTCARAQGLYACEATHVDEQMLRSYTSHLVALAGTGSQYSSRSVVFGLADVAHDIDPYIAILYRRLHTSRRILAHKPHLLGLVRDTYDAYVKLQFN